MLFSSKCRLFHNATFFGSCIIHILHTGVLKFLNKFGGLRVNLVAHVDSKRFVQKIGFHEARTGVCVIVNK